MIPSINEADARGVYPVIAYRRTGWLRKKSYIVLGFASESEDYSNLKDARSHLNSYKKIDVL